MIELLHGDCLELMKSIPDKSIDLILTDPPYGKKADKGTNGFGVACINTNRRFIGIELDENYFKIAENRINEKLKEAVTNSPVGQKEKGK